MSINGDRYLGSQITANQRKWMIKLLHPLNVLIECIDRKKGELSYYFSMDEESVDRDSAYKVIEIRLLYLYEDYENEEITIGVYKLSNKGARALALTADRVEGQKLLSTNKSAIRCIKCDRHLHIEGGFCNTLMCGLCATNEIESIYEIGSTW